MPKLYSVLEVEVQILKSNPIQLAINVVGQASTPGWNNIALDPGEDQDPQDEVLEFVLVGERPTQVVPQVVTPVSVSYIYSEPDAEGISAVLVKSRTNQIAARVGTANTALGGREREIDLRQPGGAYTPVTTLALGEESPPTSLTFDDPTTLPKWEEGFPPTDPRLDDPVTYPLWEHGKITNPFIDDPTTWAFGEEGFPTDLRADDPDWRRDISTGPLGEDFNWGRWGGGRGGFGGGRGGSGPFGNF